MKIKQMMATVALVLLVVMVLPVVNAQTTNNTNTTAQYLTVSSVKINGDTFNNGDRLRVNRGDKLQIRVGVKAGSIDVKDAEIEASINGYRYSKYERDMVTDYSSTFDLGPSESDYFTLNLQVPTDIQENDALLRLRVVDRNNPAIEYTYQIVIYGTNRDNAVQIQDYFISPSDTIDAGRALSFKLKVKNYGDTDLDDISVEVAIPELSLNTFETLNTLNAQDTKSFEALLLRIPSDAKPGQYNVVATVHFDKYESTTQTKQITVKGAPTTPTTPGVSGKTVVTMPDSIEVSKGTTGAVYPIMVENKANTAKTYVVSVTGIDAWGTGTLQPSSVVLVGPGESKTVYLNLVAKDDAATGDKVFQVGIKSGSEATTTNVVAKLKDASSTPASSSDVKNVLEWALIILVVILIILGLIVLVAKLRKGDKEEGDDEEAQTYY